MYKRKEYNKIVLHLYAFLGMLRTKITCRTKNFTRLEK